MDIGTDGITVRAEVDAYLTRDYSGAAEKLRELYTKGKAAQWDVDTDIDWSPVIEFGSTGLDPRAVPLGLGLDSPVPDDLVNEFRWQYQAWMTSQFMHGEQGALTATARLVETVPDINAKFYAASQVADEARHVDAYSRYLGNLGHSYPISRPLEDLLGNILSESRWDMIYLGMQIIVEGLALAAFRLGSAGFADPVIKQITELVARDEARHVAFGVVSLEGFYDQLTSPEIADREEFICEAALLMARRFRLKEIWEYMDLDVDAGTRFAAHDPTMVTFRRLMFAKVVSGLRRLKLLTPTVRDHFVDLSLMKTSGVANV